MTETTRDVVRDFLIRSGVTTIFGNPGSTEMRFFRDWPDELRYVLVPQESAVLAMADGYTQASGGVGVVLLHSAAGLGHALGSLYTAERNGSPLLVIAGQQNRSLLTGDAYLMARQATEFPRPYVKFAAEPARPQDVPTAIAQAFRYAVQPPAGPVFVSVPEDDWDHPADPLPTRAVSRHVLPAQADVQHIADVLRSANRPVLVLGSRVATDGARERAVLLAETVDADVLVAPVAARSPFPEDHPAFGGFLAPVATNVAARLNAYDAVVVIGAPVFTYHVASDGPPLRAATPLLHVTDDPRQAALAQMGDSVLGSAGTVIDAVLAALAQSERQRPGARRGRPSPTADDMTPEAVLAALSRGLPPRAVIVEEAPTHRNALHDHLPITAERDFYVAASGGLGWGMPAAIGIALADRGRPVVCIIGDGSSLYSVQALWTAARQGVNVVFVVLNNGGYAAMHAFADLFGIPNAPGLNLPGLDLGQVANGFGVPATRIDTPAQLAAAIASSFTHGAPRLWDVAVEPAKSALYGSGQ
jgi:benzoylformate decarboxylase